MPPVRWKLALAVAAICLAHISSSAKTGRELAEGGWKPIIGHRDLGYSEEFSKYRNPSNLETTKVEKRPSTSEPIPPPQPPPPPKPTASTINNHQHGSAKHKMKVPSHNNKHQHFHYATNQGHGPQIPVNLITHRSQNKPYKMPVMGKTHGAAFNGKRPMKPPRLQAPAHSNREEMFVAAPSSAIGSYAYFAQAPTPLKTRLPQAHGHIDFGNRFAPSEDFFQFQRLPVQQYILPKYPIPNDVHYTFQAQNDEYTRNLVPPLPSQKFPEINNKQKAVLKQKQQPVTEQVQVTKPIVEQMQTSLIPENILVQVPPPYQQQQTYYVTNQNQPVDVQVTKEKLNVFHNNIPANYNLQNEFAQFGRYQFEKKPSEAPKPPTYEVTEGKLWQQTPEFRFQYSSDLTGTRRPQIVQSQVEKVVEFLPTPLKPEGSLPTSATQSEISTVYSEVSKINRQKEVQADPSFFTVKEVSTHYPILGQPDFKQQFNLQFSTPIQDISEYSNEITTLVSKQQHQQEPIVEVTEMPTVAPSPITIPSRDWQQKRRPVHRRRKPVRPTTPEASEEQKNLDVETTTPRERPLRRRPSRYRTTEATPVNEDRPVRIRQRQRPRPTEESMESIEIPHNHRLTTEYYRGSHRNYEGQYQRTPEREMVNGFNKFGKYDDGEEEQRPKSRRPPKYRIKQESEETQSSETYSEEQKSEEQKYVIEEVIPGDSQEQTEGNVEKSTEEIRSRRPTTDQIATTNIHTPENEIDYSTTNPAQVNQQETITIEEILTQTSERTEETTTAPTTTTPTTTTTTEVTTTKSNRLRRPINYKSSPRPRFSVKEYRQRLNQYTSTSTEASNNRPSTESTSRIRYPHRSRKPITRYPQEPKEAATEEEVTEVPRAKFVPKSPRYSPNIEPKIEEDEAEKVIKTNSRIRPFGRTRSTTEATTTTQKISIKPNIYSNLRRPPQVSLRNRIFNRYNRNNTTEKTTTTTTAAENDPEVENLENETSEVVESTETYEKQLTGTEGRAPEITTVKVLTTTEPDEIEFHTIEVLKNEAVLQSQRVSDLTSSAQNDYNTPGIFKSVSSNVRRVPSYFTISTDDPILPIEAFFTNINKEKDKH